MTISSICVCGAGTMGTGIALASAQSGFHTILYELNGSTLEKAGQSIRQQLATLVSKGKISATDETAILDRLNLTGNINDCIADLCVEAIIEDLTAKNNLFAQLEGINNDQCILASNTSSLSIARIGESLKYPQRLIGLHFFNPATLMKLVEIVVTPGTKKESVGAVTEFVKKLGKTPVICSDSPGFIVNRVARPFYIEALRMAEAADAGIELIDEAMEAAGFRMGPFRLMDLIGNDVNYAVSCSVYEQLGRPARLSPSLIQEQKVKAGKLGKKSGEGYYRYS